MEVKKIGAINNFNGVKTAHSLSFGGAEKLTNNAAQKLSDVMVDNLPRSIKIMEKLRCLKGEVGGIIINSIGTGLVAPIFIAFNPLSKADEKTKKYTAMRQPVSAVLAVLIQAGLIKPLNMLYDHMINSGTLGKSPYFDRSNLHDEAYFKAQYKKAKIKDKTVDTYVEDRMSEEIRNAVKQLEEKGTIVFKGDKKLSDSEVSKLIEKTLESYKKGVNDLIKEANAKNKTEFSIKRAQLLINPKNEPKITTLCEELIACNNKQDALGIISKYVNDADEDIATIAREFTTKKTFDEINHRAASTLGKIDLFHRNLDSLIEMNNRSDYLTSQFNKIIKASDSEVDKLISEIASEFPQNKVIIDTVKNFNTYFNADAKKEYAAVLIDRLKQLEQCAGDNFKITELYQRSYYSDILRNYNNQLKLIESLKPQSSTVVNLAEKIKDLTSKAKCINKDSFAEDMVKTWKKCVDSRVKGYKQITNILFGLFITLPVTCHALNWLYPRFMDIFFPHLSKNDKCSAPEEKAKAKGGK